MTTQHDEAREYQRLCDEAQSLRIPAGLDHPLAPATVAGLRAAVAAAREGREWCSCEPYDDGDGETGPRLSLNVSESCPAHGREADPDEALVTLLGGRGR